MFERLERPKTSETASVLNLIDWISLFISILFKRLFSFTDFRVPWLMAALHRISNIAAIRGDFRAHVYRICLQNLWTFSALTFNLPMFVD